MKKKLTDKQKLRKAKKALKEISLFENHLADYTSCNNWDDKWFQHSKSYERKEDCPCIDCGACIALQALFELKY